MIAFLKGHPRYHTLNSWNRSHSYARNIKLQYLTFPAQETENTAYDLLSSDTDWWLTSGIHELFQAFARRYNYSWQVCANGRSGGYLVLYQGGIRDSAKSYKRYCTACGQGNYKEDADVCGRCGEGGLIDYPFVQTFCWPGRGVDEDQNYEDSEVWDFESLRDRVGLLWDFNTTVDTAIAMFIEYCKAHRVVAEEVWVPKTVRVAEEVE